MPVDRYSCRLSLNDQVVIESVPVHVHGHPGITDWGGTLGPTEVELEVGPSYMISLPDGRDGLIVIKGKRKTWGGETGIRYEFTGGGFIT